MQECVFFVFFFQAEDGIRDTSVTRVQTCALPIYQGIHVTYAGGEATLRFPQVIATHDYALQQCQDFGLSLSASMLSNEIGRASCREIVYSAECVGGIKRKRLWYVRSAICHSDLCY